jgi:hypothetical protein
MKIDRFGSFANHGLSSTELKNPVFAWNARASIVEITHDCVPDFSTAATHDYTISLTPDEVAKLLEEVIKGVESATGNSIVSALRPQAVILQRLLATLMPPFKLHAE